MKNINKDRGQKEFLKVLFRGADQKNYIDVRTFKIVKVKERWEYRKVDYFFERIREVDRLIKTLGTKHFKDLNIHFGVAPRCRQSGTENDVKFLTCFWCDLDCKRENKPDLPTKEEALKMIESFKLAPSILVDSGRGYHLYWLLSKPVNIRNESDKLKLRGVLAGLSKALGGDIAGIDLSRCLRIPNTLNIKEENPDGLPVWIIKFEPNIVYNIKEFEPFYIKQEQAVSGKVDLSKEQIKGWIQNPDSLELPENFYKLLDKDEKLRETFSGDRPDLNDKTKSGYSMSLASLLVHRRIFTDEQILKAMILQPRAIERKKTPQNLLSTLKKAKGSYSLKKGEKKEKKVGTKTLIPGLIHLVDNEGIIKYLIQREGNLIIEENYIDKAGYPWRPKQDLPICYIKPDILEESREFDYSHLLKDVIRFIKSYLELPEEAGYLILALWVLHTYLIEKFNVTPIIYSYGLMETGKTRTCEVMKEIAYKCETMTSPTEATLFRSAEYFKNTLVIDEVKLWGKDGNQEVARLIKSRYKRGLKVSRINMNKDKRGEDQVEYFDVFSPLLISTTESIPDIIESRCIRFVMQKNSDPEVERDIDKELAGDLRNKLTIFRANYMDKELKEVKDVSRRRLNEILKPLYQILMEIDPDREDDFKLVVKQLEESRKSEEGYSDNAQIVNEIVKFYNEEGKTFITNAELTKRVNEDKNKDEEFSINKVGWILRPFGFLKDRRSGRVGYIINTEVLKHLVERYNTVPIGIRVNLFSEQEKI